MIYKSYDNKCENINNDNDTIKFIKTLRYILSNFLNSLTIYSLASNIIYTGEEIPNIYYNNLICIDNINLINNLDTCIYGYYHDSFESDLKLVNLINSMNNLKFKKYVFFILKLHNLVNNNQISLIDKEIYFYYEYEGFYPQDKYTVSLIITLKNNIKLRIIILKLSKFIFDYNKYTILQKIIYYKYSLFSIKYSNINNIEYYLSNSIIKLFELLNLQQYNNLLIKNEIDNQFQLIVKIIKTEINFIGNWDFDVYFFKQLSINRNKYKLDESINDILKKISDCNLKTKIEEFILELEKTVRYINEKSVWFYRKILPIHIYYYIKQTFINKFDKNNITIDVMICLLYLCIIINKNKDNNIKELKTLNDKYNQIYITKKFGKILEQQYSYLKNTDINGESLNYDYEEDIKQLFKIKIDLNEYNFICLEPLDSKNPTLKYSFSKYSRSSFWWVNNLDLDQYKLLYLETTDLEQSLKIKLDDKLKESLKLSYNGFDKYKSLFYYTRHLDKELNEYLINKHLLNSKLNNNESIIINHTNNIETIFNMQNDIATRQPIKTFFLTRYEKPYFYVYAIKSTFVCFNIIPKFTDVSNGINLNPKILQPNDYIYFPNFVSTSYLNQKKLLIFAHEGATFILKCRINKISNRYIFLDKYSNFPKECEVLIRSNSFFEVIQVTEEYYIINNTYRILSVVEVLLLESKPNKLVELEQVPNEECVNDEYVNDKKDFPEIKLLTIQTVHIKQQNTDCISDNKLVGGMDDCTEPLLKKIKQNNNIYNYRSDTYLSNIMFYDCDCFNTNIDNNNNILIIHNIIEDIYNIIDTIFIDNNFLNSNIYSYLENLYSYDIDRLNLELENQQKIVIDKLTNIQQINFVKKFLKLKIKIKELIISTESNKLRKIFNLFLNTEKINIHNMLSNIINLKINLIYLYINTLNEIKYTSYKHIYKSILNNFINKSVIIKFSSIKLKTGDKIIESIIKPIANISMCQQKYIKYKKKYLQLKKK